MAGAEVGREADADVDADVGPTVAASANTLVVILQQFASPQHHWLSPHFCTGALSFCHYLSRQVSPTFPFPFRFHHPHALTSPKLQTSFKQYGLAHVGSVQPCLHHSIGGSPVPSSPAQFWHSPFVSHVSSATPVSPAPEWLMPQQTESCEVSLLQAWYAGESIRVPLRE